jgi:hypothetical protein
MPTYYAGTSGRVNAIAVTPVLTTDTVTFAGSAATIASITKWTLSNQFNGEAPQSLTLESSADVQGTLYPDLLRGGTATYSFSVEGQYDASPNTPATFGNGVFAVCDFLLKKNVAFGYTGCNGRFQNFQITGTDVRSGVVMFSATFMGSGVLPVPA